MLSKARLALKEAKNVLSALLSLMCVLVSSSGSIACFFLRGEALNY